MRQASVVCAVVVALWAAPALAQEFSYNFVACTHGSTKLLDSGPDLVALGSESWGIVANSATPEWENATTHCVGYARITGGKPIGKGLCKWVHPTGDTAVGEWEMSATGENTFTWLTGTGKLKGIQGGGSFQTVSKARPVEAGTGQSCRHDWGKYTLPAG